MSLSLVSHSVTWVCHSVSHELCDYEFIQFDYKKLSIHLFHSGACLFTDGSFIHSFILLVHEFIHSSVTLFIHLRHHSFHIHFFIH